MAIDTAQKRRSSLYSLMPFFTPSVSIDGTMSQADRQESAWAYSGILAGAVITAAGGFYVISDLDDKHEISDRDDRHRFYDLDGKYSFIDPDE